MKEGYRMDMRPLAGNIMGCFDCPHYTYEPKKHKAKCVYKTLNGRTIKTIVPKWCPLMEKFGQQDVGARNYHEMEG